MCPRRYFGKGEHGALGMLHKYLQAQSHLVRSVVYFTQGYNEIVRKGDRSTVLFITCGSQH